MELQINGSHLVKKLRIETEETIQRLSNLALDFNEGNGTKIQSIDDSLDPRSIAIQKLSKKDDT